MDYMARGFNCHSQVSKRIEIANSLRSLALSTIPTVEMVLFSKRGAIIFPSRPHLERLSKKNTTNRTTECRRRF
jgi:hypothetical protein